ncbi:unnamed protein product [Rotaria magnacalcarata]|uniref:Uncharacterized protein n=2 Tax=Rotaria magnacalcarata TaxID=392030 RepID=A0A820NUD0_9BILA|nr:unnamed protein product [Rotaria magnacalcarata]
MSLHKSKQWGWLRDTDSSSSDDLSISGANNNTRQDRKIDSFRICISAYGLSRYSKTVRMHRTEKQENIARFDQTMQMMIRIYDSRHDQRHLIHIILYGYLTEEKRYALIADQIVDSIQLVSVRYLYIYIYLEK